MPLHALTDPADVAAAYAEFAGHFAGGETLERTFGYKGGSEVARLQWFPELKIWAFLQAEGLKRYGCAFGVDSPHASTMVTSSVEINIPRAGIDRMCGGVFVRSNHNTTYLAHSGRVGGGRTGVGRTTFLQYYGEKTVDTVRWSTGQTSEYIIIGALDDSDLLTHVADFVHESARYRAEIAASK